MICCDTTTSANGKRPRGYGHFLAYASILVVIAVFIIAWYVEHSAEYTVEELDASAGAARLRRIIADTGTTPRVTHFASWEVPGENSKIFFFDAELPLRETTSLLSRVEANSPATSRRTVLHGDSSTPTRWAVQPQWWNPEKIAATKCLVVKDAPSDRSIRYLIIADLQTGRLLIAEAELGRFAPLLEDGRGE